MALSLRNQHFLKRLGSALPLALCAALAAALQWSPYSFTSRRAWAVLALAIVVIFPITCFIRNILSKRIRTQREKSRVRRLIILSCAAGLILILSRAVLIPDRFLFLPQAEITIRTLPEMQKPVLLTQFDTGTTDSFNALTQSGDWETLAEHGLKGINGSLYWHGRVFHAIRLVFGTGPEAGVIEVSFNGEPQTLNLHASDSGSHVLTYPVPLHPLNHILIFAAYWVTLASLVFLAAFPLAIKPVKFSETESVRRRASWVGYALPLIVSGSVCLMTYLPAIMSPDSIDQWSQALSGHYNDWHPAVYSLLMAFSRLFGNTPAIIAFLQIMALAGVIGWGIAVFEQLGVSPVVCSGFSVLMAILPLNPLMAITLWKDIPFAINLLLLFIFFLKFTLSQGGWLANRTHFFSFGLVSLGTAIFRHNGLPLVIIVLLVSIIFMPALRKQLGLGLILTLGLLWLIRGPLYGALRVQPSGFTGGMQLLLHHISAHVDAGTDIDPDDRAFLDQLLPLDQWIYDPCSIDTLKVIAGLDEASFYNEPQRGLAIFWQGFKSRPWVNLRHQLSASRMIWQIPQGGCYLYRIPLFRRPDGTFSWVQPNQAGVRASSKLPGLIEPIYRIYNNTMAVPALDALLWRPAWMTYWGLFMIALAAIRANKREVLYLWIIPLTQFALMFVLAFAQDMRFQYGVMLIGWLTTLLLFLPLQPDDEAERS